MKLDTDKPNWKRIKDLESENRRQLAVIIELVLKLGGKVKLDPLFNHQNHTLIAYRDENRDTCLSVIY